MATDNQKKALSIVYEKGFINPIQFALAMWPDSNMHKQPDWKVKRNGNSYLYKLLKRGWTSELNGSFCITREGIKQLQDEK